MSSCIVADEPVIIPGGGGWGWYSGILALGRCY